ncbi:NUDIX hydrolase [Paraburkholderia panacisoli]|uniref:NUDIX hydrolase n=1 Tax=Paraburkholderia panacisoli TaxID=2603818 RepID=UPI001FE389C4|nr:NUDIX domain-containing protein [Paraburkholderia panacisoli]
MSRIQPGALRVIGPAKRIGDLLYKPNGRDTLKQRATVVCQLGTRILLVSREGSRWSLPGGKAKFGESLQETAIRELMEETLLPAVSMRYMFNFSGTRTCHHVFAAQIAEGLTAEPNNEIRHCSWVKITEVARLATSVSTRGIADVLALPPRWPSVSPSRRQRAEAFILNLRTVLEDAAYSG